MMPRIILIVHIASIALIVPSYGQSSSDYAKLRRTIDKLFRKKAVSEEKVSEQVDKIVDRYALIHNQLSKQKVSSERKAIAKEGVKLFVKLYFQRLQGKSDSGKAMAVLRLVLENRALISEIMLSDEPASMISRKLMLYMERNQSLGYETPVAVKQKFFKMSVTDNDLRIVPEKIMLVSDIGLAGHQNQGIDAGETISIKLTLKNHGDKPWRSTSGFLSADDDPYLTVDQSEVVYCEKSIETGETVTFGPGTEITPSGNFMLTVSPDCPDGHRARLKLLVWDTDRGKFEQRFALTVFNVGPLTFGKAKIDDDLPGKSDGDGDAAIEPEETIEYVLGVNNRGTPEVQNVSATLISSAEFIEFLPGEDRLRFRSIAGKSERALAASYVFEVAEEDSINATQFDFKLMTRAQCRGLVYSWIRPYTEKLLLSPEKLKALQDRSPARADGPKKFKNSIGMEMVLIPAGEFQMGSNEFDAEKPIHTVKITKPFHMSSTEVTQAQYEAVMGKNPSSFKGKDLPVETISWEEAVEFCKKLSWKEKKSYRLPTEAEWEYACRSGTKTKFSFGDSENNLGDYAWYWQNSDRKTHPVGEKKSNAWGLFDMHGNVWEWCSDRYGEYPSGTVTDPTGHNTGGFRVYRGGCWSRSSRLCRSALRNRIWPSYRINSLGFRVALPVQRR